MAIDGWYYLHTNGSLIWKRNLGPDSMPESDSDFVVRVWPVDLSQRGHCWLVLVEAGALGVDKTRINELAEKWNATDEDAKRFCEHTGQLKVFKDGDSWCAVFKDFVNIQESQCGFGETALDALIELAKVGLAENT